MQHPMRCAALVSALQEVLLGLIKHVEYGHHIRDGFTPIRYSA